MKKRIVMSALAMAMVASTVIGATSTTAEAKTVKRTKPTKAAAVKVDTKLNDAVAMVFDAKYYAEQNPDVVKVLGSAPKVLLNHYIKSGMKEGRNASATFNFDAYVSANPDVAAAYGRDEASRALYFAHFASHAAKENRIATIEAASKAGIPVVSYANPDNIMNVMTIVPQSRTASSSASSSNHSTSDNNKSQNTSSASNNIVASPVPSASVSTPSSTPVPATSEERPCVLTIEEPDCYSEDW